MARQVKNKIDSDNSKFKIQNSKFNNPVLFVGAGPGDPELITVKGQRALARADLVVYAGSLVPRALLQWTKPGAESLSSAGLNLEEIIAVIERAHAAGRRVVRLHTGDPSLYGAVGEQIAELDRRRIPSRIIPGVTAAFAAAAAMKIEYTLPEISQTLILTRLAGKTPVPESEDLAALARHRASLVIYLSIARVDEVAAILAAAYGQESRCAVVYRASQPEEKIIVTRLGDLPARVAAAGITRQALIIVGKVLEVANDPGRSRSKLYDPNYAHGFRKAKPVPAKKMCAEKTG